MAQFEGKYFSSVLGEMPARTWVKEEFIKDWQENIKQNELYRQKDVDNALIVIICPMYEIYNELLESLNEEKISNKDREVLIKQLNMAMLNIQEFGSRKNQDIIASINNKKGYFDDPEKNSIYNSILDILISEYEDKLEDFDKKYDGK